MFSVAGLIFLTVGLLACKTTLATFVYLLSRGGNISELSPATTWTLQPSPAPTVIENAASVIQSAVAAVATSNNPVSRNLATTDTQSDLAKLLTSKTLQTTNTSENFQVHSIGDCHIVVKTPRGYKVGNKSSPFDVVVSRGAEVLNSSLSRLFDGVYTLHVDREEAYGVLNVTIRRHRSSLLEEHQVDFGAQWLKVAGWKKALQIVSEQFRTDLDAARITFSAAYDQISADMQVRSRDVSHKAVRHAKQFSQQSGYFLNSTAKLLKAKSRQLRCSSKRERQGAYKVLRERTDLALQTLSIYTQVTNERGRKAIENIWISAFEIAEHVQQNTPHIDLVDMQNKMQEYVRSEKLSMAQERAKQIIRDASTRWKQRRAARKAQTTGYGKKGKVDNR